MQGKISFWYQIEHCLNTCPALCGPPTHSVCAKPLFFSPAPVSNWARLLLVDVWYYQWIRLILMSNQLLLALPHVVSTSHSTCSHNYKVTLCVLYLVCGHCHSILHYATGPFQSGYIIQQNSWAWHSSRSQSTWKELTQILRTESMSSS